MLRTLTGCGDIYIYVKARFATQSVSKLAGLFLNGLARFITGERQWPTSKPAGWTDSKPAGWTASKPAGGHCRGTNRTKIRRVQNWLDGHYPGVGLLAIAMS